MENTKEKRIDFLSKELARHFTDDTVPSVKACACVGLGCHDIACAQWWRMFLSTTSAKDFKHILNVHARVMSLVEDTQNANI